MDGETAKPRGSSAPMTDEQIKEILRRVRLGVWPSQAARASGVTPQAISMRKKRDPEFAEQFERAESEAEMVLYLELREARKKHPRLLLGILERRWPERWARPEIRAQFNIASIDAETLAAAFRAGMIEVAKLHADFAAPDVDAPPEEEGEGAK